MRIKRLAQEHNTVPQPGLEPRLFDPESSTRTIRPLCHPLKFEICCLISDTIFILVKTDLPVRLKHFSGW